jgi:hypothetical protein
MEETTETGTVLLLERPRTPSEWLRFDLRTDRHSLCRSAVGNGEGCAAVVRRQAPATEPALHSCALVLLATLSILEGYARLGVIEAHHSRMAATLVGRPGAVAFAVVAVSAALLLTRPQRGLHRPCNQKLVVAASTGVAASVVLLFVSATSWASHVLGAADHFVAAAAVGVAVISERRKHRHEQVESRTLPITPAGDLHATAAQG